MKDYVLDKKRSILFSVFVPMIISTLLILGYNFIPETEEEYLTIAKGFIALIPCISYILNASTFGVVIFFAKRKYKKEEYIIDKRKAILYSVFIPLIEYIVLIVLFVIAPTNKEISHELVICGKLSLLLGLIISTINSVISFWLTLLTSLKRNSSNKNLNDQNLSIGELSGLFLIILGFLLTIFEIKISGYETAITCICLGIGYILLAKKGK